MTSASLPQASPRQPPRMRLKDRYWFKTLKWHIYKRHFGSAGWGTRYLFDSLIRTLTPHDVVIDCGANLGEFTQHLAENGSTVHAFEPDPYTFSRLRENTCHLPNVHCYNQAVGTANSRVRLYRTPDFDANPDAASISSSLFADKLNVDQSNFVEVDQIDLISFIEKLKCPVKLLKIDIEGAEVPLLEQMIAAGTFERCGHVFAETHEDRIPALAERTAKLRDQSQGPLAGKLHLDWH